MGKYFIRVAGMAGLLTALTATPGFAQDTVDPNQSYQASQADPYATPADPYATSADSYATQADPDVAPADPYAQPAPTGAPPATAAPTVENTPPLEWIPGEAATDAAPPIATPAPADSASATPVAAPATTVPREDVFTAAEGLFGRGAEGLGGILENILRDQGEPSAYISGQEAGGAFVFGVRYGSGTMRHAIEGERAVYWTGPSLGFDFGADASKVFVLVYNLHDSQDLFKRFPGAEGHAYFVGGFTAQYLRRGDVVLIPVRLGVGIRLGVNAGYMRFTERNRWVPF